MTRVTVYRCDEPGCTAEVSGPLPKTWVNSRISNNNGHRCPKHVLRRCADCGRWGRPQRFTAEQYPGTVRIQQGTGVCVNCERGRTPVRDISPRTINLVRRLVVERLDDPDDRLLVMDQLGLLGGDLD